MAHIITDAKGNFANELPKAWQRDHDAMVAKGGQNYEKGSGKDRGVVNKGPGGTGQVIDKSSDSIFSGKGE